MNRAGFDVTLGAGTDRLEGLEFCSHKLVSTGSSHVFVPDPAKILNMMMSVPEGSYRQPGGLEYRKSRLAMIAWRHLQMYPDIPILGPVSALLTGLTKHWQPKILSEDPMLAVTRWLGGDLSHAFRSHLRANAKDSITAQARVSLERVYGISVEHQLLIESSHQKLTTSGILEKLSRTPSEVTALLETGRVVYC
jgi:hypothetical protein